MEKFIIVSIMFVMIVFSGPLSRSIHNWWEERLPGSMALRGRALQGLMVVMLIIGIIETLRHT